MPKLPPGWKVVTAWGKKPAIRGLYFLGWCSHKTKEIWLTPKWWMWPLWPVIRYFAVRHEAGHAWGVKQCLGDHRWCIMAEEVMVGEFDGSPVGALRLWTWWLLFGWGRYCGACRSEIQKEAALTATPRRVA